MTTTKTACIDNLLAYLGEQVSATEDIIDAVDEAHDDMMGSLIARRDELLTFIGWVRRFSASDEPQQEVTDEATDTLDDEIVVCGEAGEDNTHGVLLAYDEDDEPVLITDWDEITESTDCDFDEYDPDECICCEWEY